MVKVVKRKMMVKIKKNQHQKNALKIKDKLNDIDGPDVIASNGNTRKENAEQVMNLVDSYENAETDDEKKNCIKGYSRF